jgi:steroid delta-isomerase-like uncharacterized protein
MRKEERAEMDAVAANKSVSRRVGTDVLDQHDLDVLPELVWEDYVEELPAPGQAPGRDGLRQVFAELFAAFPDLRWTTEEQIAEGDTVLTRGTWEGTHRGSFAGVEPTGRRVRVETWTIDRLRGGRIGRSRLMMDTMGLIQQLGVGVAAAGTEPP